MCVRGGGGGLPVYGRAAANVQIDPRGEGYGAGGVVEHRGQAGRDAAAGPP